MKKVAVVIPAYNEEKAIASVVSGVNKLKVAGFSFDAIVVNDCSQDNTVEVVSNLNCILLDLSVNIGIGGTVQSGFIYAFQNGYDFAIQVDGDGQHPPEEIPKLIEAIQHENIDVVIGSRFIDKSGFQSTFFRRLGINYLRFLIKILSGLKITDSTSGFRILNKKALEVVVEYYPDEYPEPESVILFHASKLKIAEVPVIMEERHGGKSSISDLNTIYYIIKVSLSIFYSLISVKQKFRKWKI